MLLSSIICYLLNNITKSIYFFLKDVGRNNLNRIHPYLSFRFNLDSLYVNLKF